MGNYLPTLTELIVEEISQLDRPETEDVREEAGQLPTDLAMLERLMWQERGGILPDLEVMTEVDWLIGDGALLEPAERRAIFRGALKGLAMRRVSVFPRQDAKTLWSAELERLAAQDQELVTSVQAIVAQLQERPTVTQAKDYLSFSSQLDLDPVLVGAVLEDAVSAAAAKDVVRVRGDDDEDRDILSLSDVDEIMRTWLLEVMTSTQEDANIDFRE